MPKICLDCFAYGKLWSIKHFTMNWDFQEERVRKAPVFQSHFCMLVLSSSFAAAKWSPMLAGQLENCDTDKKGQSVWLCLSEMIELNLLFMTWLLLMLISCQYLGGREQRSHCSFNWILAHQLKQFWHCSAMPNTWRNAKLKVYFLLCRHMRYSQ